MKIIKISLRTARVRTRGLDGCAELCLDGTAVSLSQKQFDRLNRLGLYGAPGWCVDYRVELRFYRDESELDWRFVTKRALAIVAALLLP